MWELLIKSLKFKIGLFILIVFLLLGFVAPHFLVAPYVQQIPQYKYANLPPSPEHLLGTTSYAEDVFSQLCTGIGNSLVVGFIAGGLGTLIAVLVGALGPYKGGLADKIASMVTNLTLILPLIPLFIIIAAVLRHMSLVMVAVILGVTSWPWAARSIRSQVLTLREREFINLARMSGQRSTDIVVVEVLPNMFAYIMMVFVILTGAAILAESALSTIGVATTSNITLGYMLYYARNSSTIGNWWTAWWWFVPPGLALTLILTAVFVMHAGMEEIFNPRLRRV